MDINHIEVKIHKNIDSAESIEKKSTLAWRPDIDGLRALAVFAVFAFHAFPKVSVFKGGFVGVDIFFVISGFLISSIIYTQLAKDTFSFWDFYSRRIRRIYPVLLTVLAGCLGFGWFYLLADEYMQLGKHIAGGAGFVSNFILFFEKGYFDNASATKPLLHFWSLGVEEQFYIFWPLILWLTWKVRKNAMFWVALAIAIASMVMNLYWFKSNPSMDYFLPHTRVWELLGGAMLAWGNLHWKESIKEKMKDIRVMDMLPHILSVSGFILLLLSIVFVSEKGFPGWQAVFPIIGTVLVIMAGKDGILNKYILSNKVMVWFGLISYPMYLWHWPLISMRRIVSLEAPGITYSIGAFVACTILAWLTTKLIENPLRFGQHGKAKTIGLFLVMVVMGCVGLGIYFKGGFPKRFPEHVFFQEIIKQGSRNNTGFMMADGRNNPCRVYLGQVSNFKACRNLPENIIDQAKKTIVVWGDSHAASLIPGFKKHYGESFNIVQRTIDGCSAELLPEKGKSAKGSCMKNNQAIFREVVEMKPWQVVLAGRWAGRNFKKLENTVNQLKEQGIHNIVVIGPVPEWKNTLPKELIKIYGNTGQYPTRLKSHQDKFLDVDRWFSEYASGWGVTYYSPSKLLCNRDGCMTMSSDKPETILVYDESHLTGYGSEYVVFRLKNELGLNHSIGQ